MTLTPEPRNQPFLRAPAATVWLIAALAAAHLARVLAPQDLSLEIVRHYAFIPACYGANGSVCGSFAARLVPFVSYMFIHAGLAHLLINSVWLLAFGAIVARRLGARLFFALFFVCGIAGALTHLLCNWGSPDPAVGASAAISGLMGVGFRILPISPFPEGGPALAPLLSQRIIVWSAVWVSVNILAGWLGLGTGMEVGLIAWQAHLGGYFAGLLLAGPAVSYHDGRLAPA